jgi:predicted HAD superfamily phosphohydrolase YqeG
MTTPIASEAVHLVNSETRKRVAWVRKLDVIGRETAKMPTSQNAHDGCTHGSAYVKNACVISNDRCGAAQDFGKIA